MGGYLSVLGMAVCAAGCAQLAGIDETTGPAAPDRVSLSMERVSIGATVVVAPQELTGYTATYLLPDSAAPGGLTRVFAQQSANDTWSAEIPEGTPPVMFTLPDYPRPIPRLWSVPSRTLRGAFGQAEHPHPVPADAGAMLTVSATLDAPIAGNESFQLYTVGTWTTRGFSGAEVPGVGATTFGPVTYAYATSGAITGRPLEKITVADQPLLLRYVGNDLTGTLAATPFDQTASDTITGTLVGNPHDQPLTAVLMPADLPARYAPARPALGNLAMSWSLNASPGHAWASNTGPQLFAQAVAATDPGAINVMYGNPFAGLGWDTTMTWSTTESRTFTPAGGTLTVTLYGALFQVVTPSPDMTLALPAGLPEAITLDSRPLSTDGMMFTKPSVALSASFLAPTPCTLYQLQLLDIVPDLAATGLELRNVLSQASTTSQFFIPPEFLEASHSYTLRAVCIAGSYPNIADGDLATRDLPLAVGYFDSGVFTVMP